MKKILVFLIILFCVFFVANNPQFYYDKKIDSGNIRIYASKSIDFDFSTLSKEAELSLNRAGYADRKVDIFIASSNFEFFFFSLGKKNIKYAINPLNGKAIINVCDFRNVSPYIKGWPKSILKFELAKAAVGAAIRKSMESISFMVIENWRIEGMAAYYSGELPLYSPMSFCSGENEKEFAEFENMMIIKYMLENMKLSKEAALKENYLRESLIKEAKPYLCKK